MTNQLQFTEVLGRFQNQLLARDIEEVLSSYARMVVAKCGCLDSILLAVNPQQDLEAVALTSMDIVCLIADSKGEVEDVIAHHLEEGAEYEADFSNPPHLSLYKFVGRPTLGIADYERSPYRLELLKLEKQQERFL